MADFSINRPECLNIYDGDIYHEGANQEWYEKLWQRRAGCGPTTASMMVWYLSKTGQKYTELTREDNTKDSFLLLMNEMWNYVTPGYRGVNATQIFTRGLHEYAVIHNTEFLIHFIDVGLDRKARPEREEITEFIVSSLKNDMPVSFLNLHNGDEKNLDRWHWVLIVSFDPDTGTAKIYDQGASKTINVFLWLDTTFLGGGFVTIDPN
jgi:hypothetical protein